MLHARCRPSARGSGWKHRRQILHGFFLATGIVMIYRGHHAEARPGSDQNAWVNSGERRSTVGLDHGGERGGAGGRKPFQHLGHRCLIRNRLVRQHGRKRRNWRPPASAIRKATEVASPARCGPMIPIGGPLPPWSKPPVGSRHFVPGGGQSARYEASRGEKTQTSRRDSWCSLANTTTWTTERRGSAK